jgi:hypothetical protein
VRGVFTDESRGYVCDSRADAFGVCGKIGGAQRAAFADARQSVVGIY